MDKKKEALDLQGLQSGGDSWTRTNVRSLNRRTDALEWRLYSFRANKLRSLAYGTPHRGDASFVCPADVFTSQMIIDSESDCD